MTELPTAQTLPPFAVEIAPPDLSAWQRGNAGVEGVVLLESGREGPHLGLLALTHGNEFAGAIVLADLLRAGFRPRVGRVSVVFANLAAFAQFDPAHPTASRYVDEDLNRLWDPAVLEGGRRSRELERARALRPVIDTLDTLVDLHSMLWPADPLILCGETARGEALARGVGTPGLSVADAGHVGGRRIIDYPRFAQGETGPAAVLVEAGQHWKAETVVTAAQAVGGVLRHLGMAGADDPGVAPPGPPVPYRHARVVQTVTAGTGQFAFVRAFHGGEVIARRNTVIAVDGEMEIRTPHDACMLVMPALRPSRGHTAVRLARLVG